MSTRLPSNGYLASPAPPVARSSRVRGPHAYVHPSHLNASQLSSSMSSASSSTSMSSQVNALKCPELLLRGTDLQRKTPLNKLEKKGKRFESPWNEYLVALYAGVLFYYDDVNDLPRGIVPLAGCAVKAVDRIFKNSEHVGDVEANAEECGPCFKVTSSANRVLLFRCDSDSVRNDWIQQIQNVNVPPSAMRTLADEFPKPSAKYVGARPSSKSHSVALSPTASGSSMNRFSLDESHMRRQSRRSLSVDKNDVAKETEISQMLRDAMALVKKQKQEILELRKALQDALDQNRVLPVVEPEANLVPVQQIEQSEGPVLEEEVQAPVETDVTVSSQRPISPPPRPLPSSPQSEISVGSAPTSGGATIADPSSSEYLQKQAMELAEIARFLQLTFQNDVLMSMKPVNSGASSTPTDLIDQGSITSSNYSDQPSEADDDDDSGSERLSAFEETDAKFLESNGILDSIHKVMRDFMSPTNAPRTKTEEFIINDDVIAELRQGVTADKKRDELKLMDPSTLRALRSQSSCEDISEFKLTLSPKSVARTRSAREFTVDDFDSPEQKQRHQLNLPQDLSVLVVEDNMAVISSILQTASRDEKSALLLPLLRLFNRHNRLSRLIRWAIESEVATVMNVATLFRSDDYASRLVSTYSKAVGSNFIKVILTQPIRDIYQLKLAEVDLTPLVAGETVDSESVQRNADNLMAACQKILDSIIANKDIIPSSYFHICSHLNAKVISRFDGSMEGLALVDPASLTRSVIGGFLFLRFVCPAITTPHLHDLVDKEPMPETRKILVLVTKLLFKTATSVLFNEKEAHLRILNPFIEINSPAIQRLFVDLSIAPAENIDDCFASDSQGMFGDINPDQPQLDMAVIRSIAEKNLDEIEKKLSVSGCSPLTAVNLRSALAAKPDEAALSQKSRSKKLNMRFLSSFGKMVRKQAEV